jgi:hypothetical protein
MTAIPFPDFNVVSPAGHIRLEMTSPDNVPGAVVEKDSDRNWFGGFQRNFVYRAFDVVTGNVVWERRQPADEQSPYSAWIDDRGWCVVATIDSSNAHLLVIGADGECRARIDLADGILLSAESNDLNPTTAGPHWDHLAYGYFAADDVWACRLKSGRRIVLNLQSGACRRETSDPGDPFSELERRWSVSRLRKASLEFGKLESEPLERSDLLDYFEVLTAQLIAGQLRAIEAVEPLRTLERCRAVGSYTFADQLGWSTAVASLEIRKAAKLAMRQMGIEPEGYASYAFRLERTGRDNESGDDETCDEEADDDESDEENDSFAVERCIEVPERIQDRLARTDRLHLGHSAWDVLELLGAPDSVGRSNDWLYDFVLPEPRTLKLTFQDSPGIVAAITWERAGWIDSDRSDL